MWVCVNSVWKHVTLNGAVTEIVVVVVVGGGCCSEGDRRGADGLEFSGFISGEFSLYAS